MEDKRILQETVAAVIRNHDPKLGYAVLLFYSDGTTVVTNCTETSMKLRMLEVVGQPAKSSEERKVGAG